MNLTIKDNVTVTFSVDKCIQEGLNGEHECVFDLSELTSDDVEQYLVQVLIIKRQAQIRAKNFDSAELNKPWKVPAPGKRVATDPIKTQEKLLAMLSKLTPEMKAMFLELAKEVK